MPLPTAVGGDMVLFVELSDNNPTGRLIEDLVGFQIVEQLLLEQLKNPEQKPLSVCARSANNLQDMYV